MRTTSKHCDGECGQSHATTRLPQRPCTMSRSRSDSCATASQCSGGATSDELKVQRCERM
eukprot:6197798-Pleurochrysis_carterae.AAC.4